MKFRAMSLRAMRVPAAALLALLVAACSGPLDWDSGGTPGVGAGVPPPSGHTGIPGPSGPTGIPGPSAPTGIPGPSGPLDVLGPVPAFEPSPVPADWVIEGTPGDGQLAVVERAGVPALRVVNGGPSFVAAKPTAAALLATPYLSWAWNMEPQDRGTHPVRLVVGFLGGNRAGPGSRTPPATSAGLPAHDRAVVIVWDSSALRRGAIQLPPSKDGRQPAARYTARGGHENTGSWWLETVDLSDIYRRAWPGDDAANARINFIGVAAAAGGAPAPGYISGIRLSH